MKTLRSWRKSSSGSIGDDESSVMTGQKRKKETSSSASGDRRKSFLSWKKNSSESVDDEKSSCSGSTSNDDNNKKKKRSFRNSFMNWRKSSKENVVDDKKPPLPTMSSVDERIAAIQRDTSTFQKKRSDSSILSSDTGDNDSRQGSITSQNDSVPRHGSPDKRIKVRSTEGKDLRYMDVFSHERSIDRDDHTSRSSSVDDDVSGGESIPSDNEGINQSEGEEDDVKNESAPKSEDSFYQHDLSNEKVNEDVGALSSSSSSDDNRSDVESISSNVVSAKDTASSEKIEQFLRQMRRKLDDSSSDSSSVQSKEEKTEPSPFSQKDKNALTDAHKENDSRKVEPTIDAKEVSPFTARMRTLDDLSSESEEVEDIGDYFGDNEEAFQGEKEKDDEHANTKVIVDMESVGNTNVAYSGKKACDDIDKEIDFVRHCNEVVAEGNMNEKDECEFKSNNDHATDMKHIEVNSNARFSENVTNDGIKSKINLNENSIPSTVKKSEAGIILPGRDCVSQEKAGDIKYCERNCSENGEYIATHLKLYMKELISEVSARAGCDSGEKTFSHIPTNGAFPEELHAVERSDGVNHDTENTTSPPPSFLEELNSSVDAALSSWSSLYLDKRRVEPKTDCKEDHSLDAGTENESPDVNDHGDDLSNSAASDEQNKKVVKDENDVGTNNEIKNDTRTVHDEDGELGDAHSTDSIEENNRDEVDFTLRIDEIITKVCSESADRDEEEEITCEVTQILEACIMTVTKSHEERSSGSGELHDDCCSHSETNGSVNSDVPTKRAATTSSSSSPGNDKSASSPTDISSGSGELDNEIEEYFRLGSNSAGNVIDCCVKSSEIKSKSHVKCKFEESEECISMYFNLGKLFAEASAAVTMH